MAAGLTGAHDSGEAPAPSRRRIHPLRRAGGFMLRLVLPLSWPVLLLTPVMGLVASYFLKLL
ncbi:conserved protein of unknown function [Rhodovastum atsumiense]|nr:conserved protein of unknown function [Rhodovastum atsumiense]